LRFLFTFQQVKNEDSIENPEKLNSLLLKKNK
jgi:hypothetical protein